MKYLQYHPADVDGNGIAAISAEVISEAAPDCANQIEVSDDADTEGMVIDTIARKLVPAIG